MTVSAAARLPALPHARITPTVPALVELALVVGAILWLWPMFTRIAALDPGRDQRFLDRGMAVVGLPEPVLPQTCPSVAALAAQDLAAALCGRATANASPRPLAALPAALAAAIARADEAFARPLRTADARTRALAVEADGGDAAVRERADAVAAIESDLAPYVERFQLGRAGGDGDAGASLGPLPLRCAAHAVAASFASTAPTAAPGPTVDEQRRATEARADAVLLLAAALDGRTATASLAADAPLPAATAAQTPGCAGGAVALAATAALMADARQSLVNARKNEAMRALVRSAGTQWAVAMALGFAFVAWSRHAARPALGVAAALATWAAAAWAARVPWPLGGGHDFTLARTDPGWSGTPATFVVVLVGLAIAVAVAALVMPSSSSSRARPRQAMSSRVGYAGFVVATGAGWLVLLDLALSAHAGNRYLALYHQGHLWLAMLALSTLVFVRGPLARTFAWLLSVTGEALQRAARGVGGIGVGALAVAATLAAVLALGVVLANMRQLTSELGRVWLILGAAWFFFLRAGPLTERLAQRGGAALSLVRYAWPLFFVVGVLVAAMFITRDMGPLLIAGYAGGAFVAAAVAMWWHHRSGHVAVPLALALLLFAGWIGAITWALFRVGSLDTVTASRLESVAAPFASINDQLALVAWFQRAAPADGFGLGAVPWCGFSVGRGCSGVPAQIHSDYTFTALVGVFGPVAAWAGALALALWLHRLIRRHGRVTRGEPRLVGAPGQLGSDGQALVSWIAVAWVVLTSCQLAVTVAGNLAVLPLTGVTVPFVSFGMTSLLVNVGFLALCLNVEVAAARPRGVSTTTAPAPSRTDRSQPASNVFDHPGPRPVHSVAGGEARG